MKPHFIFLTCSLIAAALLASCAPAGTNPAVFQTGTSVVTGTVPATTSFTPEATAVATILAQATSRGPNLEATDPSTVNLASGQLQLVEFFRFT